MSRTPDPIGEGLELPDLGQDPVAVGGITNNAGQIRAKDSIGVFNIRQAGRFFPPEQWTEKGLVPNITNRLISAQVSTNWNTWQALRDGSITGLRSRLTLEIAAGQLIVSVAINGITGALSLIHNGSSNSMGGATTQNSGVDSYSAGDLIGIKITTNSLFSPVDNDLEVYIECEDS